MYIFVWVNNCVGVRLTLWRIICIINLVDSLHTNRTHLIPSAVLEVFALSASSTKEDHDEIDAVGTRFWRDFHPKPYVAHLRVKHSGDKIVPTHDTLQIKCVSHFLYV